MTRRMVVTTHDEYTFEVPDGMTDDEAMEWAAGEIAEGSADRTDAWTDFDISEEIAL